MRKGERDENRPEVRCCCFHVRQPQTDFLLLGHHRREWQLVSVRVSRRLYSSRARAYTLANVRGNQSSQKLDAGAGAACALATLPPSPFPALGGMESLFSVVVVALAALPRRQKASAGAAATAAEVDDAAPLLPRRSGAAGAAGLPSQPLPPAAGGGGDDFRPSATPTRRLQLTAATLAASSSPPSAPARRRLRDVEVRGDDVIVVRLRRPGARR